MIIAVLDLKQFCGCSLLSANVGQCLMPRVPLILSVALQSWRNVTCFSITLTCKCYSVKFNLVITFVTETSRWREVGHSCSIQQRPVGTSLESLWDVLPEVHQSPAHWGWDVGTTSTTISSLLQDLSLTEAASSPSTAPPSKRQCRSMSCSDEFGGCRSVWRPQGSRVWTTVEKRRCHSGGSVQRGAGTSQLGFPGMQRSSSFSLPARSNALELPCFTQRLPCTSAAFTDLTSSSSEPSAQPLYLSHEQICLPEPRGASPASSPDSTPELERRGGQGGLSRSRSQPCVLNDKKIGVKRRRPADTHKQRPSLDLAKMTQVCTQLFAQKRNGAISYHCGIC